MGDEGGQKVNLRVKIQLKLEFVVVFVYPEGIKRCREEESREIFERKMRGLGEKMTSTIYKFVTSDDEKLLSSDFVTNPPKIANLLPFTVGLNNNEIVNLTHKIKSGYLHAFWPGIQVLAGDVDPAIRTHTAFFSVWKRYGFTPEGFNLATLSVQHGQKSYPLPLELIESTYWLYKATRDSSMLTRSKGLWNLYKKPRESKLDGGSRMALVERLY
ncbi:hypothetical protein POM88_034097 [Heracleum sosnowskyi]|uniref:Uncharacterized protein n=1 Tax=Heracleum sosnowskyi TaxID=360622 RepID=A0AAD8HL15_9APIA|nr:hypothetical protein POM88_034097 [Heracleum sosnowskyi]